jgi:hypothetical protein
MLLDAEELGEEFLQAFVRDCPARRGIGLGIDEARERLFIRKREGNERDGDTIGVWMACDMTEYEFGKWPRWPHPYPLNSPRHSTGLLTCYSRLANLLWSKSSRPH